MREPESWIQNRDVCPDRLCPRPGLTVYTRDFATELPQIAREGDDDPEMTNKTDGEMPGRTEGEPKGEMTGEAGAEIEAAIDGLYQGPLTEFIDARNRLATSLRKRDREAAARVKRLPKPSVSAWAVNQAFWKGGSDFDNLLDAGEAMRAQQRRALSGEQGGEPADEPRIDLGSVTTTRMEAMNAVKKHAEQALAEAGHGTNSTIMRRVSTTLEALVVYGRAESAPRAGRLSADVPAPGFDALARLAAETPGAARKHALSTEAVRRSRTRRKERSASANDNEPARVLEVLARQTQKRTLEEFTRLQAECDARTRAVAEAERAESAALEAMYEAEKDVTAAQARLEMAINKRTSAVQAAEKAKASIRQAREALAEAQDSLAVLQKRLET